MEKSFICVFPFFCLVSVVNSYHYQNEGVVSPLDEAPYSWHTNIAKTEDPDYFAFRWTLSRRKTNGITEVDEEATRNLMSFGFIPEISLERFYANEETGSLRVPTSDIVPEAIQSYALSSFENFGWFTLVPVSFLNTPVDTLFIFTTKSVSLTDTIQVKNTDFTLRLPILEEDFTKSDILNFQRLTGSRVIANPGIPDATSLSVDFIPAVSSCWYTIAYSTNPNQRTDVWDSKFDLNEYGVKNGDVDLPFIALLSTLSESEKTDGLSFGKYNGICKRIKDWRPNVYSILTHVIANTANGISVRQETVSGTYEKSDWEMIFPFCSRLFPNHQLNPFDKVFNTAMYVIPMSSQRVLDVTITKSTMQSAPKTAFLITSTETAEAMNVFGLPFEKFGDLAMVTLLDRDANTIGDFLNLEEDDQIIGATASVTKGLGEHLFLIKRAIGQYLIVQLTRDLQWRVSFVLPKRLLSSKVRVGYPISSNENLMIVNSKEEFLHDNSSALVELELEGFAHVRQISEYIYAWGNFLLQSKDNGNNFRKVEQNVRCGPGIFTTSMAFSEEDIGRMSFQNDSIKVVTTSRNGWVAALTSSGRVWVGENIRGCVSPLSEYITEAKLKDKANSFFYNKQLNRVATIYFDDLDRLMVAALIKDGETEVLKVHQLIQNLATLSLSNEKPSNKEKYEQLPPACPVKDFFLVANHSSSFTRIEQEVAYSSLQYAILPPRVFLNHKAIYRFQIYLTVDTYDLFSNQEVNVETYFRALRSVDLAIQYSNNHFLDVEIDRHEYAISGEVIFDIAVIDNGQWTRRQSFTQIDTLGPPGVSLGVTHIHIHPTWKASRDNPLIPDCYMKKIRFMGEKGEVVLKDGLDAEFYSGCPPGRLIVFDEKRTSRTLKNQENCGEDELCFRGCEKLNGVPCYYFEDAFEPVILLRDTILGTDEIYNGYREFRIVGGGPTYESIERYPEEEVQLITSRTFTLEDNTVKWICWPGSPCYGIKPRKFPNTPEYYFIVQVRSFDQGSFDSASRLGSYCKYTAEFKVRVHNLPLKLSNIFLISFGTFFALMAGTGIAFWHVLRGDKLRVLNFGHLQKRVRGSFFAPKTKSSNLSRVAPMPQKKNK